MPTPPPKVPKVGAPKKIKKFSGPTPPPKAPPPAPPKKK
jgi:hypothetical protein